MKRALLFGLLLGLLWAPVARAHTLSKREATGATKRFAKKDYPGARILVRSCTRRDRHRVLCRVSALWVGDYCIASYHVYLSPRSVLIVSEPLAELC